MKPSLKDQLIHRLRRQLVKALETVAEQHQTIKRLRKKIEQSHAK